MLGTCQRRRNRKGERQEAQGGERRGELKKEETGGMGEERGAESGKLEGGRVHVPSVSAPWEKRQALLIWLGPQAAVGG